MAYAKCTVKLTLTKKSMKRRQICQYVFHMKLISCRESEHYSGWYWKWHNLLIAQKLAKISHSRSNKIIHGHQQRW